MKSQVKTKSLVTNWAINNTIDYNTYVYRSKNKTAQNKAFTLK
ncbi:hypothetical protein SAMN04487910_3022 [Aquimarina amphilecti]|uniref:Uncharacterized protein n=1 Tax=Aquimarina amphilecti TaxID=1038014 RepID=A0A1H7S6N8_AQUAM|nr:hypothetical protein [Aquimarina amphilecti]SEL68163.1 hypothetical protein SAMN04487910_3022 [Aquimarina amphilecti]